MDTIDVAAKYVVVPITTAAKTATKSTIVDVGDRWVQTIEILFTPGHVALTGVRFTWNGQAVLPWNQPTQFIYGDNERLTYEVGMYAPGRWTIVTTNSDSLPHGHRITFKLTEIAADNRLQPAGVAMPLITL